MRRMLIIVVLLGVMGLSQAQTPLTLSPVLEANLVELEVYTTQLRGLETLSSVVRAFPSRDDVLAYISGALDEQFTDEEVLRAMRFYTAFGFLPADYDLRAEMTKLYADQVGGFYNPETKELNVVLLNPNAQLGERLPLLERVVYVHEYVHALQDQHFDLTAYLADAQALSDDALLARVALVEGDATLAMSVYLQVEIERNPLGASIALLTSSITSGNVTLPPGLPRILGRELLFPYEEGLAFVQALYRQGGWDAVNAAYANPPTTTEHILNPPSYLKGEQPLMVTLNPVVLDGLPLVAEDRLGQFYLYEFLLQFMDATTARTASQGWGGDAYQIYADDAGAWAMRYAFVGDTDADTQEVAEAFEALVQAYADKRDTGYRVASVLVDGVALLVFAPNDATLMALMP